MKVLRYNKVLGLAVGEKSIQAAEVTGGGDRPEARRLAEFVYPEGISSQDPAALGAALGEFLRANKFSAKQTVIGLPAKWLLVKPKEVPPADRSVAAEMLRLQAEGEFSSELKDLVFDYAGEPSTAGARSVLLVATPQKYVDLANALCEAARLNPIAVTSSSAALGTIIGRSAGKNAVVLSLASAGAELTAQSGGHTSALRHLRAASPEPVFLSELRRAVSMLPTNGSPGTREMIVWDGGGLETAALSESLGMKVRSGELTSLGIGGDAARNGAGSKFAAAVSLAMSGLGERSLPVDFLHSRLAAPKRSRIAKWMIWAAAGVVAVIVLSIFAYSDLQTKQATLDGLKAKIEGQKDKVKSAEAFVNKVGFAQAWHGGDPRYVGCLRSITDLVPEDGQTYATSLIIREKDVPKGDLAKNPSKASEARNLIVNFTGKAPNSNAVEKLVNDFQDKKQTFVDVKLTSKQTVGRETQFSFTCTYIAGSNDQK